MKCLLIATHYGPLIGGAQTVYDAIASSHNTDIAVLTAYGDYTTGQEVQGWQDFDQSRSYGISRIQAVRPRMFGGSDRNMFARALVHSQAMVVTSKLRKAIRQQMASNDFDVICIGALDALGYLIPWLKKEFSKPVVLYTHGEEICQKPYNRRAENRRRAALQAADGLVAVSSFTRDLMAEKYAVDRSRIEVITNGVDIERFSGLPDENVRQKFGIPLGPLVVGVGRLVARKGFDKLLESWPKIRAAVPSANLAIGGSGPLAPTLQKLAEDEDMNGSVHLLGRVPDEFLPSLYASADLFVMPNRTMPDGDTEGFGLVFLEAGAGGVPAIGGNAGGVPDAILDGDTGVLVDGEDAGAIAFAVIDLLNDEVRRKAMGERAREHAMTQGWDTKAAQFTAFLNRIHDIKNGSEPIEKKESLGDEKKQEKAGKSTGEAKP